MAKDVIKVNGEDQVVREDTAKAYRGTVWILITVGIVLAGAALLFFIFFGGSMATDGLKSPGEIEQRRQSGANR